MSLIVQDLTKRYGDKVVVDHLSFRMDQPGVYALLGSNGAGKTTSIRMMLGILARDGGTVLWNDRARSTRTPATSAISPRSADSIRNMT